MKGLRDGKRKKERELSHECCVWSSFMVVRSNSRSGERESFRNGALESDRISCVSLREGCDTCNTWKSRGFIAIVYKHETNENIRRVYFLVEEYEIECLYSSLFFFLSFRRSTKNNRNTKYSLLDKRVVDGKRFIVSTVSRNKLRFR